MTSTPYILPGGPYWVRWRLALGHSPWRQCIDVAITDGWLICHTGVGSPDILVPQHIIRGEVEMTKEHPET